METNFDTKNSMNYFRKLIPLFALGGVAIGLFAWYKSGQVSSAFKFSLFGAGAGILMYAYMWLRYGKITYKIHLERLSLMADMIKDRFLNSELSELISHKEFLEADYYLFMRTICHADTKYLSNVWCPRACVWLDNPPSYVVKAESARFLERILPATGFTNPKEFIESLKAKHEAFTEFFRSGWEDSPLSRFDLNKLGTRK